MGGRGGSSGLGASADRQIRAASGGVFESAKKTTIETVYREARGYQSSYYKDEVLEATADKDGNVVFSYARGGSFEKTAKTNRTNYVTYNLTAGAVNGQTFNINWDKVNSISGQTWNLKQAAKDAGLKWNSARKRWERKR